MIRNGYVALIMTCLMGLPACTPEPKAEKGAEIATLAQAPSPPRSISFIVNFRVSHALGRAQVLQATGRLEEAAQLVAVGMREDTAFRGLCFDRFTLGGAEIVLSVCAPSPWEEHLVTQRRWFEQIGATPGVAYVERNFVAQPELAGVPS